MATENNDLPTYQLIQDNENKQANVGVGFGAAAAASQNTGATYGQPQYNQFQGGYAPTQQQTQYPPQYSPPQTFQPPPQTFQPPQQTYQPPPPNYNPNPGVYLHHQNSQQITHTTVTVNAPPVVEPQRNIIVVQPGLEPNVCGNPIPVLDPGTALVVLILNIFFPGVGTIVCGCVGRNSNVVAWFFIGILQLVLIFCLIGWIWAIITGIQVLQRANQPRTVTLL